MLPTPKTLKLLLSELSLLERAADYADFPTQCRPYEAKVSELNSLEDIINEVVEISSRIKEVASRAVSLDLDSRRGLPKRVNREELDGLQAGIKAMHTGLDEGVIVAEAIRILSERVPNILQAFPC